MPELDIEDSVLSGEMWEEPWSGNQDGSGQKLLSRSHTTASTIQAQYKETKETLIFAQGTVNKLRSGVAHRGTPQAQRSKADSIENARRVVLTRLEGRIHTISSTAAWFGDLWRSTHVHYDQRRSAFVSALSLLGGTIRFSFPQNN